MLPRSALGNDSTGLFRLNNTVVTQRQRYCFAILLVIGWLTAAPSITRAQNIQYTQGVVDGTHRSGPGIDPATLGMGLEIPLGGYPGRGPGLPVTLYYSSKQWHFESDTRAIVNGDGEFIDQAVLQPVYTNGWTSSLGVPTVDTSVQLQRFSSGGSPIGYRPCPYPGPCYYVRRLFVHMPDGSTHELRHPNRLLQIPTYPAQPDFSGTYYAVDGSGLRYTTTNGTLYLPDGSRYVLGSPNTYYYDRNGNTLIYNGSQWTDTQGRAISVPDLGVSAAGDYTYTLPGFGGAARAYTFRWRLLADVRTDPSQELRYAGGTDCYNSDPNAPESFPTLFDGTSTPTCGGGSLFNPLVLSEIVLPNGRSYRFTYNVWGEIDKVYYPTGGYERYHYETVRTVDWEIIEQARANRGVLDRWVSAKGDGTDEAHWQYTLAATGPYMVSTYAPDGVRTERLLYSGATQYPFDFRDVRIGRTYEERLYSAAGQMVHRKLMDWAGTDYTEAGNAADPRMTKDVALVLDTGGNALAKTTTFQYDADLNPTATSRYDYAAVDQGTAQAGAIGSMPQGALLNTTETTFLINDTAIDAGVRAAYRDRNLIRLPSSTRVKDAAGAVVAQSEVRYDEAAYPLLGYGPVTGWADPGTGVRGNATTSRSWLDTAGTYVETHAQYDQCGNVRYALDARGNLSQVEYSSTYAYTYPTHTISAIPDPSGARGASTPLETTSVYDFTTGLVTSTTDANGQTTTFEYNDVMNRLTKVNRPDGGWTSFWYDHNAYGDYAGTRTLMSAGGATSEGYQFFDGLGRVYRTFQQEVGQWITVDTQYDGLGRVWRVSNPYFSAGSGSPVNPSGNWTTSAYDALDRNVSVTTPDGAQVSTAYSGNFVTVTDPAGRQRRQKVDAQGRIVRIDEPDGVGNLGSTDAPAQPTSYNYDALGNVIRIAQGAQNRYFKYNSLGQLTYERQVEQDAPHVFADALTGNNNWSRRLVYDAQGVLTDQYDARNVQTHFAYDNLNRPTQITYSDSTPAVTYTYDQAHAGYFNRGRLTRLETAAAGATPQTAQAYDYDLLGRVASQTQSVGSYAYALSYGYNVAGQLTSETYPDGRTVGYGYNGVGQLASVSDGTRAYASGFGYGAHGGLLTETLGNGAVHTLNYNARLQPSQIKLTVGGSEVQRYDYKYGVVGVDGTVDEARNAGQVGRVDGFINGVKQWEQRSSYDSLGRLVQQGEYRGDNGQLTYQAYYDYDRYGNRYQYQNNLNLSYVPVLPSDVDTTRNRLTTGTTYDAAGDVVSDSKFRSRHYAYDANGRLTATGMIGGGDDATSVYDGAGRRVQTTINGTARQMVYDAGGAVVAEYVSGSWERDNIYRGGQQVAIVTASTVQYLLMDKQGSTRAVLDAGGNVVSRHDTLPFGEEIGSGTGLRNSGQGYGAVDLSRQRYAGMERDEATGLEHTGWRKYESLAGRWTSPDPYSGSMSLGDPQSLNRYNYVQNDPINLTDPAGLSPETRCTAMEINWGPSEEYQQALDDWDARISADWDEARAEAAEREGDFGLAAEIRSSNPYIVPVDPPQRSESVTGRETANNRQDSLIPDKTTNPEDYYLTALLLGETTPWYMVDNAHEYGIDQSGKSLKEAGEPNGQLITKDVVFTEMIYMVSAVINRMGASNSGDRIRTIASGSGMKGFKRGQKELENGTAPRGQLESARAAIAFVRERGSVLPEKVQYWKAVVQGHSIRPWRNGIDYQRMGMTDFSTQN